MNRFVSDANGRSNASFNLSGVMDLLDYVKENWTNVQDYYEEDHVIFISSTYPYHTTYSTLYNFIRNTVAPAAMKESTSNLVAAALNGVEFQKIALFFVSGSGVLFFDDYIYDTHSPFTYYTAEKYKLFD